jgi:hypothetical protein
MQAASQRAGAYLSSWGAWATEKRKTGWGRPSTSTPPSPTADSKSDIREKPVVLPPTSDASMAAAQKPVEVKLSDFEQAKTKTGDIQSAEIKSSEPKASEAKPTEAKPTESDPKSIHSEAKTVESKTEAVPKTGEVTSSSGT